MARLDTMAIQQVAAASGNNAPTITIDAGSLNQTVVATHAFSMTATAADADGDSLTYQWTATPSAGVTFGTPTAEDTTFVATTAGSHTLEVVATDPSNDTASASTTMTVTAIVTADARTRLDVMKQVNLKLGYAGNEFATKDLVLAEAGVTGYGKVEFGALPLKYMKLDLATGDYASAATDTIVNKAHHDVEVARASAAEVANAALSPILTLLLTLLSPMLTSLLTLLSPMLTSLLTLRFQALLWLLVLLNLLLTDCILTPRLRILLTLLLVPWIHSMS